MNTHKAFIHKVTPRFELEVTVDLGEGILHGETLALRGLDLPKPGSQAGRALRKHLKKVRDSVEFVAVQKHEKNAFLRRNTDVFYLPGERDVFKVAAKGRCLNKELLDLQLGKPYDEDKRKIDFSKKSITVFDEDIDLATGNFKAEVCMYINDCKQYLRAALERKRVNMEKAEFDPTDEEFLIIYGLKEVKEMSMRLAGGIPLDWKGN